MDDIDNEDVDVDEGNDAELDDYEYNENRYDNNEDNGDNNDGNDDELQPDNFKEDWNDIGDNDNDNGNGDGYEDYNQFEVEVEDASNTDSFTSPYSFSTSSLPQAPKKKERRQAERKVIHPFFLDFIKCTDDPFWQQVFDDCARGKFPRGSNYDIANTTLCIRNTKTPAFYKIQQESLKSDNLYTTFDEIKEFYMTKLNITSNADQKILNVEHEQLKRKSEAAYSNTWSDINIKRVKDCIIRNFVLNLAVTHNLTEEQKNRTYDIVKLGFMFGWIEKGHITYENKQITSISTLVYDDKTHIFKFNIKDSGAAYKHKTKQLRMDATWEKAKGVPRNQYDI